MRITLVLAALLAGGWSPTGVAAFQIDGPWLGAWELDDAASDPRDEPSPYRRTAFEVEAVDGGLRVSYDMVGMRGGRTHLEWTGAFDRRDYPVQGVDSVMTNAYRRIDDRSYEITVKVDGVVAARTRVEVSPDAGTLTADTTEADAAGGRSTSRAVYRRK